MRRFCVSAAFLIAACILARPAAADPVITDIHPFELHPGVNTVPGFGVNGETFTIVQGWRGNGNAHGYTVWLVLSPEAESQPFGVTAQMKEGAVLPNDVIRDDPFDVERWMGAIRFARARIDGAAATILIDAHLDYTASRPLADHETATIRIYRLFRNDEGALGNPDIFAQVAVLKTTKRYCNVQLALRDTLHIPLDGFAGANETDGCF